MNYFIVYKIPSERSVLYKKINIKVCYINKCSMNIPTSPVQKELDIEKKSTNSKY